MKNEFVPLEKRAAESSAGLNNNAQALRKYTVGPDGFVIPEPFNKTDLYFLEGIRDYTREHHYGSHT